MKRVIIILISSYMFFMFLVYSDIFRDKTNPRDVAKYYLECIKNREEFLTYHICKKENFVDDRMGIIYKKYKMNLIKDIKLDLLNLNDKYAYVQAKIIYRNKQVKDLLIGLERNDKVWLINNLKSADTSDN